MDRKQKILRSGHVYNKVERVGCCERSIKATDPIDFWLPSLYDVVIDTYSSSREQTLETVLKVLQQ
jgi:hypothetical protein